MLSLLRCALSLLALVSAVLVIWAGAGPVAIIFGAMGTERLVRG